LANLHVLLGVAGAILALIYLPLLLAFADVLGVNLAGSDQSGIRPKALL
jgi:hypothetical protein